MRVLWTGIEHIKSIARLLDRDYVNRRGLDLSKEVLWTFVGQGAAELRSVKVGGQNKILLISPARAKRGRTGPDGRFFLISNFDSP